MAFAVKCFFSEETARPVRHIWDELAAEGLSTFLKESGSSPGFTLGVFEQEHAEDLADLARALACEARPLEVHSWGLGAFPTLPSHVFLGLVLSEELRELHSLFLRMAAGAGIAPTSLYGKNSWVPHSTLAIRCDSEKIPEIMTVCLRHNTRITAQTESISVVELGTAREVCRIRLRDRALTPFSLAVP